MSAGRDVQIDNAKGMLIAAVVFGHVLQSYGAVGSASVLVFIGLYLFHMPAFLFMSGYLSRDRGMGDVLSSRLWPYLVWQAVYTVSYRAVFAGTVGAEDPVLTPVGPLWYMFTLFLYGLLDLVRYRSGRRVSLRAVVWSLPACLLAGYFCFIGVRLSLSRSLVFLPFYLSGRLCADSGVHPCRIAGGVPRRLLAAGFAILAFLSAFIAAVWPGFVVRWLYGSVPYAAYGYGPSFRMFQVLAAYLIGFLFFQLVPRRRCAFTVLGQRSMQVFLLHMLAIHAAMPIKDVPFLFSGWPAVVTSACVAAVLCLLLSRSAIGAMLGWSFRFPGSPVRTVP